MSGWQQVVSRLDDAVNPIAVKELRQAVRGRFVVTVLVLSLIAQVLTLGGIFLDQKLSSYQYEQEPAGPMAFTILFGVLFTACMFFVPIYSGIRMAMERSDSNVDLFFITTIRPRTIVTGKFLAVLGLVSLLFSASLPFLVFSYVLRGIDIGSIGLLLAAAFFLIASEASIALFLGALPVTKPFKLLLALFVFGLTFAVYTPFIGFSGELLRRSAAELLTDRDAVGVMVGFVVTCVAGNIMLLVLATSLITPPTANRALPIRVMVMSLIVLAAFPATWAAVRFKAEEMVVAWAVIALGVTAMVLISATGERDEWGPRVARTIPRTALGRFAAFLFYSGAAGGMLWSALMALGVVLSYFVIAHVLTTTTTSSVDVIARRMLEAVLCTLAWALTATLVRQTPLGRKLQPRQRWALVLILFILGAVVPPIVLFATSSEAPEFTRLFGYVTLLNPFPGTSNAPQLRLPFFTAWLIVMLAANMPWLRAQWKRFVPPPRPRSAAPPPTPTVAESSRPLMNAAVAELPSE